MFNRRVRQSTEEIDKYVLVCIYVYTVRCVSVPIRGLPVLYVPIERYYGSPCGYYGRTHLTAEVSNLNGQYFRKIIICVFYTTTVQIYYSTYYVVTYQYIKRISPIHAMLITVCCLSTEYR